MSNHLGLDRIYVINVRAFEDRRRHVLAELARFGLDCEFIHEFDAVDLTPEIDTRYFPAANLSPAQKSCGLKHVAVLRRIAERGEAAALVLEDDVVLARDFAGGVVAALAEWPRHPHPSVIFIGSGGNFYTPRSQRRPGQRLYVGRRGRFTDSYILGSAEARLRLEHIDRFGIAEPIDNQFETIDRSVGITMLWLEEPVVEQGSKNGLFATAIQPAYPNFVQRLLFAWEKFRRKYLYQLWR
jgi:glycosyl transferase family 25